MSENIQRILRFIKQHEPIIERDYMEAVEASGHSMKIRNTNNDENEDEEENDIDTNNISKNKTNDNRENNDNDNSNVSSTSIDNIKDNTK